MGTMLGLLGLVLGAWAVRSVCIKQEDNRKKLAKAVICGWYFLIAGGLGGTEPEKAPLAIAMMAVGAALVLYWDYAYKKKQAARSESA